MARKICVMFGNEYDGCIHQIENADASDIPCVEEQVVIGNECYDVDDILRKYDDENNLTVMVNCSSGCMPCMGAFKGF